MSWKLLKYKCEILLFGNEHGINNIAKEYKVRHIINVDKNNYGTPLISSMCNIASNIASNRILAYVNADIILLNDFIDTLRQVNKLGNYMMIGRRWGIDINKPIDFSNNNWEKDIKSLVKQYGCLRDASAIDYFVADRRFWRGFPGLVIGRGGWDNYAVYKASCEGYSVVDATEAAIVIHQNHDYVHNENILGKWVGPESKRNYMIANKHLFTIDDALWRISGEKVITTLYERDLQHHINRSGHLIPYLGVFRRPLIKLISQWPRLYSWLPRLFGFLRKINENSKIISNEMEFE